MFSGQNAQFVMRYSDKVPMNRMGDPKELEGALLLLASDASSYITGQNFLIDGGLTIW
jgi:NAD(P)-dependent dehydrogenase (short-subunit alcohol dehydrogenase family)